MTYTISYFTAIKIRELSLCAARVNINSLKHNDCSLYTGALTRWWEQSRNEDGSRGTRGSCAELPGILLCMNSSNFHSKPMGGAYVFVCTSAHIHIKLQL